MVKSLLVLVVVCFLFVVFWTINFTVHMLAVVFVSKNLSLLSRELDNEILYYCVALIKWSNKH